MSPRPLDNPNPTIFEISKSTYRQASNSSLWMSESDDDTADEEDSQIDSQEIFGTLRSFPSFFTSVDNSCVDLVRSISDPEFPLSSLEDLQVVSLDRVCVDGRLVTVEIRPTQPHCSSAALIGTKLLVKRVVAH